MRRSICFLLILLTAFALASATAVGSAAELSSLAFEEAVRVHNGGTYPRMTALKNGALEYYYQSGYKYTLDSGATFNVAEDKTGTSTAKNAASTVVVDGITHALARENHHALELSDGTVMMAYRSLTKGYVNEAGETVSAKTVDGKFYTSIRVMTKTNYTGEYANEQTVVENVYNSSSGERRGYWEPFFIQLDDATVAMYYADDLSPADGGANQYIMVVLYDIKTGTWGEPTVAVNKEKNMGREGMPMVARLVDGNYVMAVESHCLQSSRKYVFVVRLWFSRDGINWDKGVVVAAPGAEHKYPVFSNLEYHCAAPCVTVLPDGRIAVSYQDDYKGSADRAYKGEDNELNTACIILSKDKVTYDNCGSLVAATRGISSSFAELTPTFKDHSTVPEEYKNELYGVWNSTFYANGYLYFCAAIGYNSAENTRQSLGTYVCRALVDASRVPSSDQVAERYGTVEVSRPEQLLRIMNDSAMWNKKIVLVNDIDFADSIYSELRGFTQKPIGYLNTAKFTGSFDGRGNTIKGLDIKNTVSENKTALFGYCDKATVKNCTLYGSVSSTAAYCGSFVGYSQLCVLEDLTSYVTVSGTGYVGGIAGRALGGSIGTTLKNCVNYGNVSGTGSSVGGIVGLLDTNTGAAKNTVFSHCVNNADVSGNSYVGGLIGHINHLTKKGCTVEVADCKNYGNVSAKANTSCVAGIVGQVGVTAESSADYNGILNVYRCENHGAVTGRSYIAGIAGNVNFESKGAKAKLNLSECKNYGAIGDDGAVSRVAGIAGRVLGTETSRAEISLCYNGGSVTSGSTGKDMGGIVAVAKYADVSDCESRCDVITANSEKTNVGGVVGMTNTSASIRRCYFTGNTSQNPIVGSSPDCTSEHNYYYVASDISDADGTAIELDKSGAAYAGLDFEKVWYATVLGPGLRFGKTFIKGDVDGNGTVEIADVVTLQRYLANWNGYAEYIVYDSADVYGLGSIDIIDAVWLIRHLAGWSGYEISNN